ncbi:hypothetical protein CAI21_06805 [Alkalilimnicola ehrlichii]|uniref:LppC family lipoprotein n=1 Tax=Alkalilimnicola ehrlichii TaxID=351052 RepID=A0A3E0X0F0_9GAMM|nr:penicillin-binding protein activator [Alkalilimnicola ehrlichii]RFA30314.1 hypothetical protein CAI21_06805 [Alkalilimnicola ehrlichii]RFA37891.1 hypothetical protein CAL65_08150 [Alkalilimnicola ehrlichii]
MQQKNSRFISLLSLIALAVVLASCATAPRPVVERSVAEIVEEADAAIEAGDIERAAEQLRRAATKSVSPEREHLLLRAASLYLYLGNTDEADALIGDLPSVLPAAQQFHRELLEVRQLLLRDRPAAAYLSFSMLGEAPEYLHQETLRLRAEVSAAVGLLLESAEARAELHQTLSTAEEIDENMQHLWNSLSQTPMELLRERMPPPPDAFGGWLELAFTVRTYRLDVNRLENALKQWQRRYPDHPAADVFVQELLVRYRDQLTEPQQLAILLPLSGPVGGAGQAIRDGFLAAYYATNNNRPSLRIYDTGSEDGSVLRLYDQAVADGADFIIGPLTRGDVATLAARGELPVPTLALNTLPADATAPEGLYQFGLSPEDEARSAALYAIERGYENALVLVPEGDWGERVAKAFAQAFEGEYQQVLETRTYPAEGSDFSVPIRTLLNLNASDHRQRLLRRTLQRGFHFESRRRQDADFIFLGAFPRDARLIQPQLRFHHAMDLPILATSHVFSGVIDTAADQDMNGIRFVDMPWLLDPEPKDDGLSRSELAEHWPGVARQPRLYALGIDAYRIIPYLEALQAYSGDTLDGKTGVLQVDTNGRVQRMLLPAQFTRGQPRLEPRQVQPSRNGIRFEGND